MDKEVIRNLCVWMATRHEIELREKRGIRVGSNQSTRYGSATRRGGGILGSMLGAEEELSVSISTYNTDTGSEHWNTINKIIILDTIVHEFAHLSLFKEGYSASHSSIFLRRYHKMLAEDWEELVAMYNLLAADDMSSSLELLVSSNNDRYFDERIFCKFAKYNPAKLLENLLKEQSNTFLHTLIKLQKHYSFEIGNECMRVIKDGESIAELIVTEDKKLKIKE